MESKKLFPHKKPFKPSTSRSPLKDSRIRLPLFILQSRFYNYLNNLRRPRILRKNKKEFKDHRRISSKFFLFLFLISLVLLLVFNIAKYLQFNPINYSGNSYQINNYDSRLSVLFLGLDDRVEDYRFVDILVLLDLDLKNNIARLYAVNPLFSSRLSKGYNLRTVFNNLETTEGLGEYIKEVEALVGIKVDNYIALEKSYLVDTFSNTNLTLTANDNYVLGDKVINQGEGISINEAINILIGNPKINDDLLKVQLQFLKTILEGFKNKLYLYGIFLNPDEFLQSFKTSLNKDDFISLLLNLSSFDIIVSAQSIMRKDLAVPSDVNPDIFIPNYLNLDENIITNFRDFEVIKEQAQIEIYNATNVTGMASEYQRMLQNRGSNIIKIGNYSESSQNTILYLDLKKITDFRNTLNLIYDLIAGDVKILDISEYKYNYSGNIILILGDNLLN